MLYYALAPGNCADSGFSRQPSPGSRIIFVTRDNDEDVRMSSLATGAEAYVLKANAATELLSAIDVALGNGYALR